MCFFSLLRNVAQETLDQVEDIEANLNSSEHVREEVMALQEQTDEMIANINNITETVSRHHPVSLHSVKARRTFVYPFCKRAGESVDKREAELE